MLVNSLADVFAEIVPGDRSVVKGRGAFDALTNIPAKA
jgi:hypothetical protein